MQNENTLSSIKRKYLECIYLKKDISKTIINTEITLIRKEENKFAREEKGLKIGKTIFFINNNKRSTVKTYCKKKRLKKNISKFIISIFSTNVIIVRFKCKLTNYIVNLYDYAIFSKI